MKVSKKKIILAVIMAVVATVITAGLTAFKADASGSPKVGHCFMDRPILKGVKWQIANDYYKGLYKPEIINPALVDKFDLNYVIKESTKPNAKAKATTVYANFSGKTVKKAKACYETYIWSQMYSQDDGKPMFYSDGSPVLYQRVVDSGWKDVNPRKFFAWSWDNPKIGQRGIMLTAWVVGGK